MLDNFENFNMISLNKENVENKLMDKDLNYMEIKIILINWLKYEYHPKVLFNDIIIKIEFFNYVDKIHKLKDYQRLKYFIIYTIALKEYLNYRNIEMIENIHEADDEILLKRFYDFIQHFKKIIII